MIGKNIFNRLLTVKTLLVSTTGATHTLIMIGDWENVSRSADPRKCNANAKRRANMSVNANVNVNVNANVDANRKRHI